MNKKYHVTLNLEEHGRGYFDLDNHFIAEKYEEGEDYIYLEGYCSNSRLLDHMRTAEGIETLWIDKHYDPFVDEEREEREITKVGKYDFKQTGTFSKQFPGRVHVYFKVALKVYKGGDKL